jgi:hypothetical protein
MAKGVKDVLSNYFIIIESLSSCAIEGNKFAIEMLRLERDDPKKFWEKAAELGWIDKKGDMK